MGRLLAFVAVIAVGVICLGFYLGWFHIGSTSADGTTQIKLTVDQKKIQEDEKKVEDRVRGKK